MTVSLSDPSAVVALGLVVGSFGVVLACWVRAGQRALDSRFADDLDRLRSTLEGTLRDALQSSARAQSDMALHLAGRLEESRAATLENLSSQFRGIQQALGDSLATARRSQDQRLDRVDATLVDFGRRFQAGIGDLERRILEIAKMQGEGESRAFGDLRDRLAAEIRELRRESEAKLEQIRCTVEEKLHSTLESRLGESFRVVSERLERVHQGLGEMQALASGVGDLKRVLTNIRSRGTFGEVQLEALLAQVLAPAQYAKNVATVPGSSERVEFAVRLPGQSAGGGVVYLPIDAKFPQEDYARMQEAYESGNGAALDSARRALRARLLREASAVRAKYLSPPHTTDFALLFLPTEGLYSEALRIDGLAEHMQRESRVVLVGPTTLYAVLNSLQMGFRTLAIQKRSDEVWKVLGAVKTEFGKFGLSLAEVKKKLEEAAQKIESSERRSRVMQRALQEVETLPEEQNAASPLGNLAGGHALAGGVVTSRSDECLSKRDGDTPREARQEVVQEVVKDDLPAK